MGNLNKFLQQLSLIFLLLGVYNIVFSQTIVYQDFEGGADNWNYSESPVAYNVSGDIWDIVSSLNSVNPSSNSAMWGMQDLDNASGGGTFDHTLTFASVDVSTVIGAQISFDYYTFGFEIGDYLKYEIFEDGVGQGQIRLDQNTQEWRTITYNVPDVVNSVYIVLIGYMDTGSDYGMFDNVKISGTTSGSPLVAVSQTTFNFDNVYTGTFNSEPVQYTVRGANLSADIVITAPAGYEVSTFCTSGYANSLTLTQSGGTVAETTIYTRFNPNSYGIFTGNFTHTSTGATTKNIVVDETNVASNLPGTYYSTATGTGATLKTQLHNIINGHTVITYGDLWTNFYTTDDKPNSHKVWDMYSDQACGTPAYEYQFGIDQTRTTVTVVEGDTYEREHTFPKSWWGYTDGVGDTMYTDIFAIIPADAYCNRERVNYPYGKVTAPSITFTNGAMVGPNTYGTYTGTVYEPVDEYKGDLARNMFYMATRYDDIIAGWELNSPRGDAALNGTQWPSFEQWFIDMLLSWHIQDPVSQKEKNRNDDIYLVQGNRNPYIDNPNFANLVWGTPGTSTITAGTAAPATISSLTDTQIEAVLNFEFVFNDDGLTPSADTEPTMFSQLEIVQGIGNAVELADWTQAIAGAELSDGTTIVAATISSTKLTFSPLAFSSAGDFGYIADNGSKTYTLKIWLNSALGGTLPATIDGKDFVFDILASGFTFEGTSSTLADGESETSGDGLNVVEVIATALNIIQQPSDANVNIAMVPDVTIEAIDANGNRDLDHADNITVVSTGITTVSPIIGLLSNGLATFSNIVHSQAGVGLILTASSGTLPDINSGTFIISAPKSADSDVIPVAASESATVPSNENTPGPLTSVQGIQVWQFTIRDGGGLADADEFATIVNQIVITQNAGNSMNDWDDAILACDLFDGTTHIASAVIGNTTLTFSGAPLVTVPDNGNLTLTLRLSLQLNPNNLGNNLDGDDFVFNILSTNITADASGSGFSSFTGTQSTNSMNVFEIVTTKLLFVQQPTSVGVGIAMTPDVTVEATDANGNRDLDFNANITLTSTGTMTGDPITVTAVSGLATFSGIIHTAIGTNYTMTASTVSLTDATSTNFDILDITVLEPGDLMVLAVNTDNQIISGEEFTFICFKDLKEGTAIDFTDNGWERDFPGKWGGTEGVIRLSRAGGAGILPAGTSVTVVMNDAAGYNETDFDIFVGGVDELLGTPKWTISELNPTDGSGYNMNASDDLWIMQNGDWIENDTSTDPTNQDDDYTGNVLYGWTATGWPGGDAASSTSFSNLYPFSDCFNTDVSAGLLDETGNNATATERSKVRYTGDTTATSKYGWIARVNDVANWTGFDTDSKYDTYSDGTHPNYEYRQTGITITINPGGFVSGVWTGAGGVEWFDCANWQNLTVPDATTDVLFGTAAVSNAIIDASTPKAIEYGGIAECNDLTISNQSLTLEASVDNKIEVNGNLLIDGTGVLDMDDGTVADDGQMYLSGNWTNQGNLSSFLQGHSTIHLLGTGLQTISTDGTFEESFYNLLVNNTSTTGIQQNSDVTVEGELTHILGEHDLNGNNITLQGNYTNTSGLFIGDIASDFTIIGAGTLGDIYFETDFNLNNFTMNRAATNANLMTNLSVNSDMTISAGSVTLNSPNQYDVFGLLNNSVGTTGLIIKSDINGTASLIHNTAVVNATVERYLSGYNWHYVFSPLSAVPLTQVNQIDGTGNINPNFYFYDETQADYWDATTIYGTSGWTTAVDFAVDKGYILYHTANLTYNYTGGSLFAGQKDFTLSYNDSGTGNINTNGVTADWDDFEGWNLLGNPYPSAIDWDNAGIDKTYIENVIYYYDDSVDKYLYYGSGTTFSQGITVGGGSSFIPAGQAVFVKSLSNGNTQNLAIPNNARAHSLQAFWKTQNKNNNLIRIQIENEGYTDETVIRTLIPESNVSEGFDADYDAHKLFAINKTNPQLYTEDLPGSHSFAINSIPEIHENKIVPLKMHIGKNGIYALHTTEFNFENTHVWLEDVVLNTKTRIYEHKAYHFSQSVENYENRFFLHFDINNKPVVNIKIPDQETEVHEDYIYNLPENVFIDNDFEDVLTITASLSSGEELPVWLEFNSELMNFSGIPDEVQTLEIKLTAKDIFGAEVSDIFSLNVKSLVSVSVLNEQSVFVYPNPTNDVINIFIKNNNLKGNIKISNVNGQELFNKTINSNNSKIDLSKYPSGVYFIEIKTNNKTVIKKIVKK
ncbi:MAG: endonuclease [Bacteroidales bacterium]|nr:endonuclease [Bacteroidales bacterium]